jgi:DNA-binding NtrC family response regulator
LPVVLVVAAAPICQIVAAALEGHCALLAAVTGRAAAELCRARPPRLVIFDGDLTQADLPALLLQVRASDPDVPILVIEPTSVGPRQSQMRALGPVLTRPLHPGQILEAVSRKLGAMSDDPIDQLMLRVHRSRTTRFER